MSADDGVEPIVARVLASRRYHAVDPALVRRIALDEAPKARTAAEAEKRVKRRLHQVVGAYRDGDRKTPDPSMAFDGLGTALDDPRLRARCRELLARHASSRERVSLLDGFYAPIFAVTGPPRIIADLACGLNPLALPWMGLPSDVEYRAYDVDRDLIGLVGAFFRHVGARHRAEVRDVLASPPGGPADEPPETPLDAPADVALLLKTLPCLEHQQAGAGHRLVRAVTARYVVVSYPTRSLGGRGKGQAATYRAQLGAIVAGEGWTVTEIEYANELVAVIGKGS